LKELERENARLKRITVVVLESLVAAREGHRSSSERTTVPSSPPMHGGTGAGSLGRAVSTSKR
jgi:hypothetical protein